MKKDNRIDQALEQILSFAQNDFSRRSIISDKADELDALLAGLNTLGEEIQARINPRRSHDSKRMDALMEMLLRYTTFDFSEKILVSHAGDEIDAIAAGLNTLVEELQYARETEKKRSEELEYANQLLKQAEERTRLVISEVRDYAIFSLSPEGNVISWNKGAERIDGYSEKEIIGKHFSVFYPPEAVEKKYPQYELETAAANGRFEDEGWRVRKDGSLFWANVVITALRTEGKLIGFSKITRDLTRRKELEDTLRESNQKLLAANKELESFTYTVSHDLRAPLRAVHGFAQMLLEEYREKMDGDALHMLDTIMRSSTQMGKLIDDLLEFSRLGRRELAKVKVNMKQIALDAIKQLKEYMPNHADITVHDMDDAYADPPLINQVYVNLISNAIKYSAKKEKPAIEIGQADTEKDKAYYVSDNGAGFDMRFYNKLFGVFQRLHKQEEFEGTGVGLAIVHRIITRHDGEIWAKGEPGKGAIFYFTLKY